MDSTVQDGARRVRLFTRGRDSVRVEVVPRGSGATVLVKGPGSKRASYDCVDALDLVRQQAAVEAELAADGFALERFVTERRRWPR